MGEGRKNAGSRGRRNPSALENPARPGSPPNKRRSPSPAGSPSTTGIKDTFHIVGIGASAGGLEAFELFFTNMPADSGMAFVLVQHLDPTHKSILTELIRTSTRMTVKEVEDG